MNIALILQSNAAKFSDRTAIVEAGRRISFVELDRGGISGRHRIYGAPASPAVCVRLFSVRCRSTFTQR